MEIFRPWLIAAGAILLSTDGEIRDDFARVRPIDSPVENVRLNAMEGKEPPTLVADGWNTPTPLNWNDLRGKVVLLDFWGVWCKPCLEAIPKLKQLYGEQSENGLVIIGIHTAESRGQGERYVRRESLPYPVAFDSGDQLTDAYNVVSYPAYYIVDRKGVLRIAQLDPAELEYAVRTFLSERLIEDGSR